MMAMAHPATSGVLKLLHGALLGFMEEAPQAINSGNS